MEGGSVVVSLFKVFFLLSSAHRSVQQMLRPAASHLLSINIPPDLYK